MGIKYVMNPMTGQMDAIQSLSETIPLADLSDVTITSVADNEVLAYDNSSSKWINQTAAEAGLSTLALGETSTTAYRGDRGKIAYDHSQDNTQAHTDYLLNSGDDSTTGRLTVVGLTSSGTILPNADNTIDLGSVGATDYRFRHIYLSGNISDETNSLTVANAKTAYDNRITSATAPVDITSNVVSMPAATTSANGYLTSTNWNTFNGKQNALTFGIANTNAVQIDSTTVADDEYARFTASGLESRSTSEVLSDIGAAASSHAMSTHSDEDTYNISTSGTLGAGNATLGTIGCNAITVADGQSISLQEDISFTGATTVNMIKFPDALADALSFKEGANAYMTFVSTNGSETITFGKTFGAITGSTIGNLTLANGSITDSGGAIGFGNENLSTSGTLSAGATTVTSLVLEGGTYDTTISPGTPTASVTYQWPLADGSNTHVLTTNGSGTLSWAAAGAGANTALSNLASVAINTTLVSDADNTDDLGTDAVRWRNLFLSGKIECLGGMWDDDQDTGVQVEEGADEDIIRMDVATVEAFKLSAVGILDLAKQSRVRAYQDATDQTISTSTTTTVTFDAETDDNQNEFASNRFTATNPGAYLIYACLMLMSPVDASKVVVTIYKNGSTTTSENWSHVASTNSISATVQDILVLAANDYIDIQIWHDSGSNKTISSATQSSYVVYHKLS